MLKKRIIPCLDIHNGRTVKGINFKNLIDAGNPVQLAQIYSEQGADELVFLDISASVEGRKTTLEMAREVAQKITIPFTVGGGINSVDDAWNLLKNGADKISVNSAAIKNPKLIEELSNRFGNQCVVIAIDAKNIGSQWKVFSNGGRVENELELISWSKEAIQLGAGEILFTSMDQDGTKSGFALEMLNNLSKSVNVPIIASGGCGSMLHFKELFEQTTINAALAASVFHFDEIRIPELKKYLKTHKIEVRC